MTAAGVGIKPAAEPTLAHKPLEEFQIRPIPKAGFYVSGRATVPVPPLSFIGAFRTSRLRGITVSIR
eukprot:3215011-Amphidinium_carterae.1